MSILTNATSGCSFASALKTGAMARHGPHHLRERRVCVCVRRGHGGLYWHRPGAARARRGNARGSVVRDDLGAARDDRVERPRRLVEVRVRSGSGSAAAGCGTYCSRKVAMQQRRRDAQASSRRDCVPCEPTRVASKGKRRAEHLNNNCHLVVNVQSVQRCTAHTPRASPLTRHSRVVLGRVVRAGCRRWLGPLVGGGAPWGLAAPCSWRCWR